MKNGKTKSEVVKLRTKHPEYTQVQISKLVGVTKQRVMKILKDENLPRLRYREPKYCVQCKAIQTKNKFCSAECKKEALKAIYFCKNCNKAMELSKKRYNYHKSYHLHRYAYCSRTCYYEGKRIGWS